VNGTVPGEMRGETVTLSQQELTACTAAPRSTKIFRMRRALTSILLLAVFAGPVFALPQSASRLPQKHGREISRLACKQILQMSSSDWVAKSTSGGDSSAGAKLRAIESYGRCYDARTSRLAAALAKIRRGPSRAARESFLEFDAALKDFTAKALAAADPPAGALKSAYAALYEKQFRYAFYQTYEPKAAQPPLHAPPATPALKATPVASASASASASPAPATAQASADTDPLTSAKNHFGELLSDLPDDQMHELHAAFGGVLGPHAVTNEVRLAVYRYAIFLLEPPSAEPFSPPPF
jgi:hypothetical protein